MHLTLIPSCCVIDLWFKMKKSLRLTTLVVKTATSGISISMFGVAALVSFLSAPLKPKIGVLFSSFEKYIFIERVVFIETGRRGAVTF